MLLLKTVRRQRIAPHVAHRIPTISFSQPPTTPSFLPLVEMTSEAVDGLARWSNNHGILACAPNGDPDRALLRSGAPARGSGVQPCSPVAAQRCSHVRGLAVQPC